MKLQILNMTKQNDISAYVIAELPEIERDLEDRAVKFNMFKIIDCLTSYTREKIIQHDLKTAKKCFAIAEKIYSHSNALIEGAIENVFVQAIASLFTTCNSTNEKRQIHAMIPLRIYTAYIRQEKLRNLKY